MISYARLISIEGSETGSKTRFIYYFGQSNSDTL